MNYGLEAKEGAVIEAASRNSAVTEKNTSAAPIIPPKSEFEDTEVAAGREALINLMNKNRMLHVLELLLKFGVETLEDLIYCMRNYDDEELMKYIGLLRFQILRLRKAAKTWETSDSAHEAAQPAQHQAASTLRPPQQEQIAPNHQKLHAGRGPPARSLAKYSGVSFDKIKSSQKKMWKAQIRIDGKKSISTGFQLLKLRHEPTMKRAPSTVVPEQTFRRIKPPCDSHIHAARDVKDIRSRVDIASINTHQAYEIRAHIENNE